MVDDPVWCIRLASWVACLASCLPAAWRLIRWRQLYLDPLWLVVGMLALNRLLYLTHASKPLSDATAAALALTMAVLSLWYQRHDQRT